LGTQTSKGENLENLENLENESLKIQKTFPTISTTMYKK